MTPQKRAELSLAVAQAMGKQAMIRSGTSCLTFDGPFDPTIPGADAYDALMWLRKDYEVELVTDGEGRSICICVDPVDVGLIVANCTADTDPLAVALAIEEIST